MSTLQRIVRESRENTGRQQRPESESGALLKDEQWEAKGMLEASDVPPRPGFVQRWIRTVDGDGRPDSRNLMRAAQRGWRPRPMSAIPKGSHAPAIKLDGTDVVGVPGMVLMERPEEVADRQRQANRSLAQRQLAAVREDVFRVRDPAGRDLGAVDQRRSSSVSTGRPAPMPAEEDGNI